jgi:hypothetical protein
MINKHNIHLGMGKLELLEVKIDGTKDLVQVK